MMLPFLLLFFFICVLFSIAGAFSLARIVFCLRRFGGRRLVILLHDASIRFLLFFFFICILFSIAGAFSLAPHNGPRNTSTKIVETGQDLLCRFLLLFFFICV